MSQRLPPKNRSGPNTLRALAEILWADKDPPPKMPVGVSDQEFFFWAVTQQEDPRGKAWRRLHVMLNEAIDDPTVKGCEDVRAMAFLLANLVATATDSATTTSEDVLAKLESAIGKVRRIDHERTQPRAQAKVAVQTEWHRDKDGYPSKADFSRIVANRLNREGVRVTPRTIEEDWLKGM